MKRRVKVGVAIGLGVLLLLPLIGLAAGQARRASYFGETPDLGVRYSRLPGETDCQEVTAVLPKAHFNWKGETWQDSSLNWQDVRIEYETGNGWNPIPHGKSGPIEIGQKACGLSSEERWRWVYIPDEKTLVLDPI